MSLDPRRRAGGFTLVEMLMSVALTALVLVAAVALILAASRFSLRALESAGVHAAVTKVFRVLDDEIALAREFPSEAEGYRAGEDTLIVLRQDGGLAVYVVAEEALERLSLGEEGGERVVLAKDLSSFRFSRAGPSVCYSFSTYLRSSRRSLAWEGCSRAPF